MFRTLGHSLLLAAGAQALDAEVPIYCRLLSVALQGVQSIPVLGGMNVTSDVQVPLIGDVDVSVGHLQINSLRVVGCDASVDPRGNINLGFTQLDLDMNELHWQYAQRRFPHHKDDGRASANTSMSLNITIDTLQQQFQVLGMNIETLHLHLGSQHHQWVTGGLEKLVNVMRPLVSQAVRLTVEHALDDVMTTIYTEGACALATGALGNLNSTHFQFTSTEPFKVHVPVFGDVNISVNSTSIVPPTSMQCHQLSFTGDTLAAHIEDVDFSASFVWAYQKPGSSFWQNAGNGSVAVVAGSELYVDTLQPAKTKIRVDLPMLKVALDADADSWMYNALMATLTPLIRHSMQLFGGRMLTKLVTKCLADPNCPHMRPEGLRLVSKGSPEEVAVLI